VRSKNIITLEITLRGQDIGYNAELRRQSGNTSTLDIIVPPTPINISEKDLPRDGDHEEYGKRLTAMLFGPTPLRDGWMQTIGAANSQNALLRICLRIEPSAARLHGLQWETLQEIADSENVFATSEHRIFSRTISSENSYQQLLPRNDQLRALVVIANPTDSKEYGCTPIQEQAFLDEWLATLAPLPYDVIGHWANRPAATLETILQHLRTGKYQICYFICHGRLPGAEGDEIRQPYLLLENPDGSGRWVEGRRIARDIGNLREERPFLVVFGSCDSAANEQVNAIPNSVAQILARAGLPAVIGMHGKVPMPLVRQLMPRFFRELMDHGIVDLALNRARIDLPFEPQVADQWWRPVLYMRPNNQLALLNTVEATTAVSTAIQLLLEQMNNPEVRAIALQFQNEFRETCKQLEVFHFYKALHDQLHKIQINFYQPTLFTVLPDFPNGHTAMLLRMYVVNMQTTISDIKVQLRTSHSKATEEYWFNELLHIVDEIHTAEQQADTLLLDKALGYLGIMLNQRHSSLHEKLKTAALSLPLDRLYEMMVLLHQQSNGHIATFVEGALALEQLKKDLGVHVSDHNRWQSFDMLMRTLRGHPSERQIRGTWQMMEVIFKDLLKRCQEDEEESFHAFIKTQQGLDYSIKAMTNYLVKTDTYEDGHYFRQLQEQLETFYLQATHCFYRIDTRLLQLCNTVKSIGDGLNGALRLMVS
jgi:hypothetical protein